TRAERQRHREHPENHRERGHDDRAEADAAGLYGRSERAIAVLAQLVGESDQQVAVGDADTDGHDRAHQRFDVDGRARYREHPEHAGQRSRHRHHDDERLEPRLKVRDHQQVHEDDGENQAFAKGAERIAHRLALAADDDVSAGGQLAEVVDLALYGGGGASQVAAVDGGVNVDDALHRVMRDDGGIPSVGDRAEVAEQLGLALRPAGRRGSAQRYVRQRGYGVDQMLRRLRHDAVVHTRFRIEPEVGLQQHSSGKRGEHARGDLLLRDAEFERLVAIDVHAEGRIVLRLGNPEIADAGNEAHLVLQAQRDVVVGLQIVAVDLRVDR